MGLLSTYECIVTHIHHPKNMLLLYNQPFFFFFLRKDLRLHSLHFAARLRRRRIGKQHSQVVIVWERRGRSWLPPLPHLGLLGSPAHCLRSALCIRGGRGGTLQPGFQGEGIAVALLFSHNNMVTVPVPFLMTDVLPVS